MRACAHYGLCVSDTADTWVVWGCILRHVRPAHACCCIDLRCRCFALHVRSFCQTIHKERALTSAILPFTQINGCAVQSGNWPNQSDHFHLPLQRVGEGGEWRESAKVKVVYSEDFSLAGFKVLNLPCEKPSRLQSALFKTPRDSTLQ